MNQIIAFSLCLLLNIGLIPTTFAFELSTEKVTENIYAIIGDIAPRTKDNEALNNTMGFVITDDGVVLVGSGATEKGAELIEAAIAKITDKKIIQVVNIGAQDHHWMGNSYFSAKKIPIIALTRTVKSQKEHTDNHLARLEKELGKAVDKDKLVYATSMIESDEHAFIHGDINFELKFLGASHFPDDAVLWLPKQKVIFTGDMVFNDRMLGVHPFSDVKSWNESFKVMAQFKPDFVIPGHGHAGALEKAQKDTGDYLNWLVTEIGKAVDDMQELADVVQNLSATKDFDHLEFHDQWNSRNINLTFLQLEVE